MRVPPRSRRRSSHRPPKLISYLPMPLMSPAEQHDRRGGFRLVGDLRFYKLPCATVAVHELEFTATDSPRNAVRPVCGTTGVRMNRRLLDADLAIRTPGSEPTLAQRSSASIHSRPAPAHDRRGGRWSGDATTGEKSRRSSTTHGILSRTTGISPGSVRINPSPWRIKSDHPPLACNHRPISSRMFGACTPSARPS